MDFTKFLLPIVCTETDKNQKWIHEFVKMSVKGWWIVTPLQTLYLRSFPHRFTSGIMSKQPASGPKWGMLHPFEYRTLPITLEPSNPGTNASNVIPTHKNLLSIAWYALRAEDTYAKDSPLFGGRHRYPFFNALYFRHWKAGSSDGSVFSALRIRRKGWDMYFDQEAFGKRLEELRNIKGMTQEELAEKLNISREHLGRIERGKYGCSIDLLIELSFTL